ncbi:MAG TPA: Rieske 2Fe-2S domain-containing protein [Candidatus Sulfopaludibacter sp.]|nr:Rieske 2Fe-2S domain-containing protein [Candidatus Sulfopaludibacter sp.]
MSTELPVRFVEQQDWLEPVETGVQKAVAATFHSAGKTGRQIQNALHGTWLGHPLHPVLTDVPLGAWTATLVLDAMEACGRNDCRTGADVTLKLGLAGAGCAALAGLTDWHVTDGKARRVGIFHGMLNLVSVGLYAASWMARSRRNRSAGRGLAFAGFAVSSAAAYLGGSLVYGKQIGVNHTGAEELPAKWTPVMNDEDLREDKPQRATVKGTSILLLRRADRIYCIAEVCSHLGGPLAEGQINGETVTCPWHGSCFSLKDGSVIDGPAVHPQPSFQTRVHFGRIEVKSKDQE